MVSLGRTPHRTIGGLRELQSLGLRVEVVDATDGRNIKACELPRDPRTTRSPMQPGEVALCDSLFRVCGRIVRDDLPWALFFEDDVRIIRREGFLEALEALPDDFHFAHLNDSILPAPVLATERHAPAPWLAVHHPSYVTVAYAISNAGARAILRGLAPFDRPIDSWLVDNEGRYNIYQLPAEKAFFTQSQWSPSTVRENNVPVPIPKVIHRIWVGSDPIKEEYEDYWRTWRKFHPDYQFKTWGNAEVRANWPGHPAIAAATTPAGASDIIRLLILEREGGMYVDTDFECFHSFDELIGSAGIVVPDMHDNIPCNGWLAAAPLNGFIRRMREEAESRTLAGRVILEAAGPAMVKDIIDAPRNAWPKPLIDLAGRHIATSYGDTGLVVIKPDVMFPYYWNESKPATYGNAWAAHHWAASWWDAETREAHYQAHPHLRPA